MSEVPVVLAADDEPSLTSLYETWLDGRYTTHTASDGHEALDVFERNSVDVVLLDRQMPGLTGGEVLERIRSSGDDVQVVMVTAVRPDLDVARMSFDDYLEKPIERTALLRTVESALTRTDYASDVEQYCALARRKAVLDANVDRTRLASSSAYRRLVSDLERARRVADERRDEIDLLGDVPVLDNE